MIVMNFWKVKIGPYFKKSYWNEFFVFLKNSIPDGYIIEIFKWDFILMDFMGFSSTISKVNEIVIVKNYTNEIS
jgi:hypothetical protein